MDPQLSTTLQFRLTDETAMRELIGILTAVFHVVPAAVPDAAGHVLSVEVDGNEPGLIEEVRSLVIEGDPGATELEPANDQSVSGSGV